MKPIDIIRAGIGMKPIDDVCNAGECVDCKAPNLNFRTMLEAKEYTISGLCQTCQDIMFGTN